MADARWAGDADGLEAVVVDQENLDDFCTPLSPGRTLDLCTARGGEGGERKTRVQGSVCSMDRGDEVPRLGGATG